MAERHERRKRLLRRGGGGLAEKRQKPGGPSPTEREERGGHYGNGERGRGKGCQGLAFGYTRRSESTKCNFIHFGFGHTRKGAFGHTRKGCPHARSQAPRPHLCTTRRSGRATWPNQPALGT
eukprot:3248179-Pleurochrysis_carterae.AAC.1